MWKEVGEEVEGGVVVPFIMDVRLQLGKHTGASPEVTQEKGQKAKFWLCFVLALQLPPAVLALLDILTRFQRSLSLVGREVEPKT